MQAWLVCCCCVLAMAAASKAHADEGLLDSFVDQHEADYEINEGAIVLQEYYDDDLNLFVDDDTVNNVLRKHHVHPLPRKKSSADEAESYELLSFGSYDGSSFIGSYSSMGAALELMDEEEEEEGGRKVQHQPTALGVAAMFGLMVVTALSVLGAFRRATKENNGTAWVKPKSTPAGNNDGSSTNTAVTASRIPNKFIAAL
eukprot:g1312.t1